MICLDTGHFHPTESIADKISALLPFMPEINLHISRGIRWDSDHVPVFSDEVRKIAQEIVRCKAWDRVRFGLDFFDASINRVGAWVLGARSVQKALLAALLEPAAILQEFEDKGDYLSRLAGMEAGKTLPLGTVWDMFCLQHNVPCGQDWLEDIKKYEREVLSKREKSEE
jgi:L-rhamnose isomerase